MIPKPDDYICQYFITTLHVYLLEEWTSPIALPSGQQVCPCLAHSSSLKPRADSVLFLILHLEVGDHNHDGPIHFL